MKLDKRYNYYLDEIIKLLASIDKWYARILNEKSSNIYDLMQEGSFLINYSSLFIHDKFYLLQKEIVRYFLFYTITVVLLLHEKSSLQVFSGTRWLGFNHPGNIFLI